eukprot:gene17801-biopygen21893
MAGNRGLVPEAPALRNGWAGGSVPAHVWKHVSWVKHVWIRIIHDFLSAFKLAPKEGGGAPLHVPGVCVWPGPVWKRYKPLSMAKTMCSLVFFQEMTINPPGPGRTRPLPLLLPGAAVGA